VVVLVSVVVVLVVEAAAAAASAGWWLRSNLGKSVFVRRFVHHIRHIMTPIPHHFLWCYGGGTFITLERQYEFLSS
jgi:hypothetical protein